MHDPTGSSARTEPSRRDCRATTRRLSRRQIIGVLGASVAAGILVACGEPAAPGPLTSSLPSDPPNANPATVTSSPPTLAPPTAVPSTSTPDPTAVPTIAPSPTPSPDSPATAVTRTPERLQPNGPARDPGPLDWAHPGPYFGPSFVDAPLTTFSSGQPLVTTYYFYWDDLTDPNRRESGRSFHPTDQDHYSYLNVATHRKQFDDMRAAGIDFALPVYWGEPGHPGRGFEATPGHYWSTEGIPPIVEALDQLAAGGHPFKVGMFYDTTILANADLTTPNGKAYFYVNVRDFFSRIPPRHWAAIDGKPIVWLYDTQWVSRYDQSSFDDLSARFAADFGGRRPYIVREYQWYGSKGIQPAQIIKTDNFYGWGAALSGFNPDTRFGVAEVGPGFDNTGDCHDTGGHCTTVSRAGGASYARQLAMALRSGRKIMAIETWNEFDESTGIAETIEFGRTYIDLTRAYADAFHAGRVALGQG